MCAAYDHADTDATASAHTNADANTNTHAYTVADANAMPVPTHKADAATTGHDGDHGDGDAVEYRACWLCWPGDVSYR